MHSGRSVAPVRVPHASIFLTTSIPSTTWPKTTCLPSRWSARCLDGQKQGNRRLSGGRRERRQWRGSKLGRFPGRVSPSGSDKRALRRHTSQAWALPRRHFYRARLRRDEELAAIRVGAAICHGYLAGRRVPARETARCWRVRGGWRRDVRTGQRAGPSSADTGDGRHHHRQAGTISGARRATSATSEIA